MSHRRKSARPTNKLRRATDTSSVSSDSDADHNKMLIEEYASSRDEVETHEGPPASPTPQLHIPPDLWQDFQALRAATNLDTATLMRRLIQDYGRAAQPASVSPQPPIEDGGPGTCINNNEETPMEYQTPTNPEDDDSLILDLSSSGVKAAPDSVATTENEYYGEDDADAPLDLTVCRTKRLPQSGVRESYNEVRAPEAHKNQSGVTFLFATGASPPYMPANYTPCQPRTAHSARPETSHSPGSKAGHGLHRVHNAASHPSKLASNRASINDQSIGDGDVHSNMRMSHTVGRVSHSVSQAAVPLPVDASRTGTALHPDRAPRVDQPCVTFPVLSSSSPSILRHHLDSSGSSPAPGPMQLPTVTSLEFIADTSKDSGHPVGERGVYSVQMKMPTSSEASILSAALPVTSASAFLLDPASGGLVTASGGLVSAVNIPLMTTTTGGLVAIPFLHTLPETLTAPPIQAPHPPACQTSPPANPSPASSAPPSMFSSTTPTSTASSKSIRPKLGRPRGQGKSQKAPPKDMKLVTENTLFPGVYTSILKLPWSKRARGKSAKIKNAAAQPPTSTAAAVAACAASTNCVESYSAARSNPVSASGSATQLGQAPTQAQQAQLQDAVAVPINFLSMPMLVPERLPPTPSTASSSPTTVSASSSQSVMMVYPSGTVSAFGKPVRRRGRPPKLPMLSHLLAEKSPRLEEQMYVDQTQERKLDPSQQAFASSAAQTIPSQTVTSSAVIKPEPTDVAESDVKKRGEDNGGCGSGVVVSCGGGGGGGGCAVTDGCSGEKLEGASLETRFNILANQLGLEIGSSYHASLVQATPSEQHAADAALYQEMLLSSRSLVEVKPRRRQLNDLIKPNDDCVYTSFRITPRQGGRGGKSVSRAVSRALARKRAAQMEKAAATSAMMDGEKTVSRALERRRAAQMERDSGAIMEASRLGLSHLDSGEYDVKMGSEYDVKVGGEYDVKGGSGYDVKGVCFVGKKQNLTQGGGQGSAVITERIPGAGDAPLARLYQDLYHCKLCNEMLPPDDTLEHTCGASVSPSLRSCDSCGTMFSVRDPSLEHSGQPLLCHRCVVERSSPQCNMLHASPSPPPSSVHDSSDHSASDAFACLPCGVRFVAIADYIEHRRSAHLDKLSRQPRKTHTLKTQVCPAQACPRLFHTQAELARHVREEHNHDMTEAEREQALSACSIKQEPVEDGGSDLHQETDDLSCAEDAKPQYTCTQNGCTKTFHQPIDLLEHVQASHEDVTEWSCPMSGCTRVFAAERHLRVHLLMHKDEKPLKCKFCNYCCRQKNALNWHMRKHPESAGHYRKFAGLSADV